MPLTKPHYYYCYCLLLLLLLLLLLHTITKNILNLNFWSFSFQSGP